MSRSRAERTEKQTEKEAPVRLRSGNVLPARGAASEGASVSTIAYAVMTDRRLQSPQNASQSSDGRPPGMTTILDGLAAAVPAEVLVVHAFLASQYVESGEDGTSAVIVDTVNFGRAFYLLAVAAVVLFIASRVVGARGGGAPFGRLDLVRALIPGVAFCAWAMLLEVSAFDAAYPRFDNGLALLLAVTGYLVVGGLGAVLGQRADAKNPTDPTNPKA